MLTLTPAAGTSIESLVELWNVAFGPDFPMTTRLLRQGLEGDPTSEPEGSIVALAGDKLVGWVLCKSMSHPPARLKAYRSKGGIGALCVHPDHRRQGIGSRLLDHAEKHLRKKGAPLTTFYYPHHFLPGIPAESQAGLSFFQQRGFRIRSECADLWRALDDYQVPEKVQLALTKNPSVEIRPARENEQKAILNLVAAEFSAGWLYGLKRHFDTHGRPSDIIVVAEGGCLIGFCHTADWTSKLLLPSTYWHPLLGPHYGGLGPLGIAEKHRKRGLGLALTALAVDDLKRRGVTRMAIDWTTLIEFYQQLGFTVWKRYLQASKP